MHIRDNPIYAAYIEALGAEKALALIKPSQDTKSPRSVQFLADDGSLISEITLDLEHNDFMVVWRQFGKYQIRMRNARMADS